MLVFVEHLYSAYKASYNLKGRIIYLEKFYNENKDKISMKYDTESMNSRIWVKYKDVSFWLSRNGKITVFGLKQDKETKLKPILTDFYHKMIVNYLVEQ